MAGTLANTTTGTLAAAEAGTFDIPCDGYSRLTIVLKNTGGSNAIGTTSLLVSMDGTTFAALAPIGTAVGSLATSGTAVIALGNLTAHTVRVSLTSSSGSTYSAQWMGVQAPVAGATECRVNGTLVGSQSTTGTLTATTLVATGDVEAAGGFRQAIGPFFVTTAADQSAVGTKLGDTLAMTWVAPRAGSVTAAVGMLDTAITGAATTIKARVYKNGSLLNAALDLDFTQAGAEVKDYAVVAKDTYTFAAGDEIDVVYTSTTITNTPKLVAFVEVEC